MLEFIRKHTHSVTSYIIFGAVLISFIGVGAWGDFSNIFRASTSVAKVNGQEIAIADFQQVYQTEVSKIQQQGLSDFVQTDSIEFKKSILDRMVADRLLQEKLNELKIIGSIDELAKMFQSQPIFLTDDKFDPKKYQEYLNASRIQASTFERSQQKEMGRTVLLTSLLRSEAGKKEAQRLAATQEQQREYVVLDLSLSALQESETASAEEIAAYFAKHQASFTSKEKLQLAYVTLKMTDIAPDQQATEEEIAQEYQHQQEENQQKEVRESTHILFALDSNASARDRQKKMDQAKALYAQYQAKEKTFDQLMEEAKKEGGEASSIGRLKQGEIGDPVFDRNLFALEKIGDVSAPFENSFGVQMLRLDQIDAPSPLAELAEMKEELTIKIQKNKMEQYFIERLELAQSLAESQSTSLQPIANEFHVSVEETPLFNIDQPQSIAENPTVISAAMDEDVLKGGKNSPAVELDKDTVVFVRVKQHELAAPLTLEQAQDQIVAAIKLEKAKATLAKQLAEIKEKAAAGTPLAELTKTYQAAFRKVALSARNSFGQNPEVHFKVFEGDKPEEGKTSWFDVVYSNGGAVIGLLKVVDVEPSEEAVTNMQKSMMEQYGQLEVAAYIEQLRAAAKIEIFDDRL